MADYWVLSTRDGVDYFLVASAGPQDEHGEHRLVMGAEDAGRVAGLLNAVYGTDEWKTAAAT